MERSIKIFPGYFFKIRSYNRSIAREFPSLPMLAGIIGGILPGIISPGLPFYFQLAYVLALAALSFIFFSGIKYPVILSVFSLTGLIMLQINSSVPPDNYSVCLKRPDCGAIIRGTVNDTSIVNRKLDWLPKPSFVNFKISDMKYAEGNEWKKVSGSLYVKLPEDSPFPAYGNVLALRGEFMEVDKTPVEGGFDFRKYLALRKIYRIFYAEDCKILEKPRSFYSYIMEFRDAALAEISRGIKSPENKRLLTNMLFGCRQGLDWENRQTFIRSGTIHIFSVSGLHVGILALIFFWIFRFLPFRPRYFLVPFLILLYTISTGMAPPAVRALLMISLWSFCRAFLYQTSPLNVVFVSASLLLLWNPFYIMDTGFQYSFVTVAFLILSYRHIREWTACISERLKWIPSPYISWRKYTSSRFAKYVFLSVLSCLIAWLASTGISVSYQGLYVPFAVPANILISPLIPLIFILSILKLALFPLAAVADFSGLLIDYLFSAINAVCSFCAWYGADCHIVRPPLLTALVFYAALLFFLSAKKRFFSLVSLLLISGLIIFWHLRQDFGRPGIFLFHGGKSQEVCALICDQSSRKALLVNAPSFETCRAVSNLLSLKGIDRIDTLILGENKKDFCAGAKYLMSCSGINRIIIPKKFSRSPYARNMVEQAYSSGIRMEYAPEENGKNVKSWAYSSYKLKALSRNSEFSIEYNDFNLNITLVITDGENGMRTVKILVPGRGPETIEFENRNNLIMKSFYPDEKKT